MSESMQDYESTEMENGRLREENMTLRGEIVKLRTQIAGMEQQAQLMAALFRGATPTQEGVTAHQKLRDQLGSLRRP